LIGASEVTLGRGSTVNLEVVVVLADALAGWFTVANAIAATSPLTDVESGGYWRPDWSRPAIARRKPTASFVFNGWPAEPFAVLSMAGCLR